MTSLACCTSRIIWGFYDVRFWWSLLSDITPVTEANINPGKICDISRYCDNVNFTCTRWVSRSTLIFRCLIAKFAENFVLLYLPGKSAYIKDNSYDGLSTRQNFIKLQKSSQGRLLERQPRQGCPRWGKARLEQKSPLWGPPSGVHQAVACLEK